VSDYREQLMRRVFGRWNDGDRTLPEEEIHPDAVVRSAMTGDTFRGVEEVRAWMAEIDEQFEDWVLSIEEVRSIDDDRLLVLGAVHFRGRASGVEFDQPMGWIFGFKDDLIYSLHNFTGQEAAIEAAGLAPNS
jgi:ketosteroid isomerase-like protein